MWKTKKRHTHSHTYVDTKQKKHKDSSEEKKCGCLLFSRSVCFADGVLLAPPHTHVALFSLLFLLLWIFNCIVLLDAANTAVATCVEYHEQFYGNIFRVFFTLLQLQFQVEVYRSFVVLCFLAVFEEWSICSGRHNCQMGHEPTAKLLMNNEKKGRFYLCNFDDWNLSQHRLVCNSFYTHNGLFFALIFNTQLFTLLRLYNYN